MRPGDPYLKHLDSGKLLCLHYHSPEGCSYTNCKYYHGSPSDCVVRHVYDPNNPNQDNNKGKGKGKGITARSSYCDRKGKINYLIGLIHNLLQRTNVMGMKLYGYEDLEKFVKMAKNREYSTRELQIAISRVGKVREFRDNQFWRLDKLI